MNEDDMDIYDAIDQMSVMIAALEGEGISDSDDRKAYNVVVKYVKEKEESVE